MAQWNHNESGKGNVPIGRGASAEFHPTSALKLLHQSLLFELKGTRKTIVTGDEQLLEQIVSGDKDSLAEFIARRQPQLLAFITRQMSDGLRRKVEPEDIFQEASAEAVRSLDSMDLSERDPFSWLCQVAERKIIDAHRRFFAAQKRDAGRERSIDAPGGGADSDQKGIVNLLVASMTSASAVYSRNQKEIKLLAAMEELPDDQREALHMRYILGFGSKEIGEKLGKSDGAVRVMLSRSLAKLQTLLGDDAAPRK